MSSIDPSRWHLLDSKRGGWFLAGRRVSGKTERRRLVGQETEDDARLEIARLNSALLDPTVPVLTQAARTVLGAEIDVWLDARALDLELGKISKATHRLDKIYAKAISGEIGGVVMSEFCATTVAQYEVLRRRDGASPMALHKEIVGCLGPVLKSAKKRMKFAGDPKDTIGVRDLWAVYRPRTSWVEKAEAWKLVTFVAEKARGTGMTEESRDKSRRGRAAMIALLFATGCRISELFRLKRSDFTEVTTSTGKTSLEIVIESAKIRARDKLKGEKTHRKFLVTRISADLVAFALENAPGAGDLLFPEIPMKFHRDLGLACKRAGVRHLSPNDCRRSFISWACHAGIPETTVARWCGNSSTMIRLVYKQTTPGTRADEVEAWIDGPSASPPPDPVRTDRVVVPFRGTRRAS